MLACLSELSSEVDYTVVVNDYNPGESLDLCLRRLIASYDHDNPGYGRAVNRLFVELGQIAVVYDVLNTDLTWDAGALRSFFAWIVTPSSWSTVLRFSINLVNSKLCKQNTCWVFR